MYQGKIKWETKIITDNKINLYYDFVTFSTRWALIMLQTHSTFVPVTYTDSKVHVAHMGPTWDRQDSGGPHVGHVNLAICAVMEIW